MPQYYSTGEPAQEQTLTPEQTKMHLLHQENAILMKELAAKNDEIFALKDIIRMLAKFIAMD